MFHQFNGNNISKIHIVSKLQGILKILPNPILSFAQVFVFLSNKIYVLTARVYILIRTLLFPASCGLFIVIYVL